MRSNDGGQGSGIRGRGREAVTEKKAWRYCLEVRDLDAGYNGTPALDGITFAIPPGQMVGVIGPNGAGKTTLFKAILGLIPHQSGEILLHDAPALDQRAMMGYLPHLQQINPA